MPDRDTLAQVAEEVGLALAPLGDAISSPAVFRSFMLELGWDLSVIPQPVQDVAAPLQALVARLSAGDVDASSAADVIGAIGSVIEAIRRITSQPAAAFPPSVDAAEFAAEFPRQLIDSLIVEYLLNEQGVVGQLLRTLGVIRLRPVAASGLRPAYLRREIAWEDLARLLEDPGAVFRDAYDWGEAGFRQQDLLDSARDLLSALGLTSRLERLEPAVRDLLSGGAPGPDPIHDWVLRVPLIDDPLSAPHIEAGIGLFMLPAAGADQPGFALLPYASGLAITSFRLTDSLDIVFRAGFDITAGVGILARPDQPPRLLFDLIPSAGAGTAPPSGANLDVGVITHGATGARTVLIGSAEMSRLAVAGASLMIGARVDSSGKLDGFAELDLRDGQIVVKPAAGDADSFISSLLPPDGLSVSFGLIVGFSSGQGLYFGGSGALEINLPTHVQLGPIEITSVTLAARPQATAIQTYAAATISGALGPLKAVVQDIGLRVALSFPPERDGAFGPVDLALGFKPPNGVGLALDASVIKGGGFLSIDVERGEYAGALELTFSEVVALKAIGLITTKMPDGSAGFSLLIIITAEFGEGIQLGFGFTLLAVGGLVGLNRTMRLQPLLEGVRTGAVNRIMFPQDVVANAPRILSDLRTIFPPQEGTFLIGPMAKLGWGTPTLISLSLGIIIEIPGDIAILGVLRVVLPADDVAILVLQVNFVGAIEFDKQRMYFFAALFESRILFIPIEGEMGLLVALGADANFVVSVGGFHPRFNPPPLPFPSPKRVSVSLVNSEVARVRIEGYFAVTSNTVQFGAHAEAFFGFDEINVHGDLAFDALFQFSPFYFIIQVSASFSVDVFGLGLFGVGIHGSLEGPTPWRVNGEGSISLLFFDISVPVHVTWGETRDTTLPPIAVMPLFTGEFEKEENWRTLLPPTSNLLVTLRKLAPGDTALVLHPVGVLQVSQRLVPLGLSLDKVGTQKPSDVNRLSVAVASGGLAKQADALEQFALAQFQDMSDADKLSRPAFTPEPGGLLLSAAGQQLGSSRMVKRTVRYEQIIIDTNYKRFARRFVRFPSVLFDLLLRRAAVARSDLAAARKRQLQPFDEAITVQAETYAVVFQSTNQAYAVDSVSFSSEASARDYLTRQATEDPNLRSTLQVVPDYERAP